jgi:G3E family GTPase
MRDDSLERDDRIPVTLLCGFLGSGKTTLLNRILRESVGRRLAVIVNEFGELNIDSESIIRTEEDIFELSSGCICCTVRSDLIDALERLVNYPQQPEYILIETTGLADVRPLIQTFIEPPLDEEVRLDSIITLVDAKHVEKALAETNEAYDQIAYASFVVLNKIDLVEPAQLDQVEARVRKINPRAPRLRTTHAQVDLHLLLDAGAFRIETLLADQSPWHQVNQSERSEDGEHTHLEAEGYSALAYRCTAPLDRWAFDALLRSLPDNIFRAKGFLWLANDPEERYRFDVTGSVREIEWVGPWLEGQQPENRMVFIGRGLDAEVLRRQLDACRAPVKA